MSVEGDMGRVEASFEAKKGSGPEEEVVADLIASNRQEGESLKESLNRNAENPKSLVYTYIEGKYPDILDRELLAGVLGKKYFSEESPLNQEYQEMLDQREKRSDKGLSLNWSQEQLITRFNQIHDYIEVLLKMNDTAYKKLEASWEKEECEDNTESDEEVEKSAQEKLSTIKLKVPSAKDPENGVVMSLEEYITAIAKKMHMNISVRERDDLDIRVNHLKDVFNRNFSPRERELLYTKARSESSSLAKEYLESHRKLMRTEPTNEDVKRFEEIQKQYHLASLKTYIYSELK